MQEMPGKTIDLEPGEILEYEPTDLKAILETLKSMQRQNTVIISLLRAIMRPTPR
jgi:hypothetical protein